MGSRPIIRKALKFATDPYFCRIDRVILGRLKENTEKY